MGANGEIKREAVFQPEFLEDLEYWVDKDRKMALRIEVTLEEATKNLDSFCKQIAETDEVVFINRPDGKNVVLISQSELESLLETLYLLRSPKNSARLLNALQRAKAKVIEPQEVSALYEKFGLSEDNTDNDIAAAS